MRLIRYTYPTARACSPDFARSPWAGLENEIDRLFASSVTDLAASVPPARFPVDLYEDKDNSYVRAELPGINRADINVELVDGYLTITANRKTPAAAGQPEQTHAFTRSVSVSDSVQTDRISAQYENGILTVTLPKREEAKPKKIAISVQ
jgi:HSP20 family protein